jgi:CHAT domain-containing protein
MRGRRCDACRLLAVSVLLLLISACQTGGPPSLSLEEAKQVTATFKDTGFKAPPRTIRDITAILDSQGPADPRAAAERRAAAETEPPAGADDGALAAFYFKRGLAANLIGRMQQGREDLRKAHDHATKAGSVSEKLIRELGWVEFRGGNGNLAVAHMRESEAKSTRGTGALSALARILAWTGDLKGARRTQQRMNNRIAGYRRYNPWPGIHQAAVEASILEAEGKYSEAASAIRLAVERFLASGDAAKFPTFLDTNHRAVARNLRAQGRLLESEVTARDALLAALERDGKYAVGVADLARELATTLLAQGRYQEAETLFRASVDIMDALGLEEQSMSKTVARQMLGTTLGVQGDWEGALRSYEEARRGAEWVVKKMEVSNSGYPTALIMNGRIEEAEEFLVRVHAIAREQLGDKHSNTAEKLALLAMTRGALGKTGEALRDFATAMPVLLSRSRRTTETDSVEQVLEMQIARMLEAYIGVLAQVNRDKAGTPDGDAAAAEAFRLADVARGRLVQQALVASGARAAVKDPALADLVRREQDTRKQIGAGYAMLTDLMGGDNDPAAILALRARVDQLRGARAALMEEIEARFPEYAQLINPKPATLEDARAILHPGEALISTFVAADRVFVWAVPKTGPLAFASTDLEREDLGDMVALLRSALEPNAAVLGDIPDFDVETAHELYSYLLEPVKAGWQAADSLLVVAHGPLGYLPLSVLPTEAAALAPAEGGALFASHRQVPWLARSHAVTMLPSVASLRTLRALPPGDAARKPFAGFGDPLFSAGQAAEAEKPVVTAALTSRGLATRGVPVHLRAVPKTSTLDSAELARLPRLPDTAEEIRGTALALKADLASDVFLGSRANEDSVKTLDLSGYKVVAFATHGLVPGDLNGLTQPALALSAPDVAGVGGDGLLTMGEILGLRLNADWVVLSACNTGSGEGAGAEAVSGLGRAFFYAGTRALLVSNWPVETTSAKALTTDLFRRQAEDASLSRAQALRQAMLALIDGPGYVDAEAGKTVFSYAHPIFWAPFSLIGDGGGRTPPGS